MKFLKTHFVWALLSLAFFSSCKKSDGRSGQSLSSTESNIKSQTVKLSSDQPDKSLDITIHAPLSYYNLQVFPLSSITLLDSREYKTLAEALENKWVTLFETGNVSELQLDNPSEHFIFIQSGDIVKGGRQDRTMQYDVIIAPQSERVPIASFCVEAGRWSSRENEYAGSFSISEKALPSKKMRLSAKKDGNQSNVWKSVSDNQTKLTYNVSKAFDTTVVVTSGVSNSSLQLTLENDLLDSLSKLYMKDLESFLAMPEINGFAYAINGRVFGADIYNNQKLFAKLSEKGLESFIVEAISLRDSFTDSYSDITMVESMLELHLREDLSEKVDSRKINNTTRFKTFDMFGVTEFVTSDIELNEWLHINFVDEKDEESSIVEHAVDEGLRRIIPSN